MYTIARLHITKYYLMDFILLLLLTFSFHLNIYAEEKIDPKKLEGYEIKFDYEKYPEEREIAYQYYLDKRSKYIPNIPKNKIGIDLYDIDDDGKKEIFVYVDGGDRCPRAGCPCATLKQITSENGTKTYQEILWSVRSGASMSTYKDTRDKILKTKTLGYHDILVGFNEEGATIWKWNGKYYDIGKVFD